MRGDRPNPPAAAAAETRTAGTERPCLALFDLCDTLYCENTTRGFVGHVHKTGGHRARALAMTLVHSKWSPGFYICAALYRFTGRDPFKALLVRSLRGLSAEALNAAAADYVRQVLPRKRNAPLQALFAEHLAAGDRVVIVSNSIDVVVEAVAAQSGVAWRGSPLEFDSGICTGRLIADIRGRKSSLLADLLDEDRDRTRIQVYTDNMSDRDLIECADQATVVIPKGKHKSEWGAVDADFLEL